MARPKLQPVSDARVVPKPQTNRGKRPFPPVKLNTKAVKIWLIQHDQTPAQLAAQIPVHVGTLNSLLQGKGGLSTPVLIALANITGLTMDVLVGRQTNG